MTGRMYRQIRGRIEAELEAAKASVAALAEKLKALDLVYNEILNDVPEVESSTVLPMAQPRIWAFSASRPPIGDVVREVALHLDGEFDVPRLIEELKGKHPEIPEEEVNRSTVSGRLRRMAICGELAVVKQGSGPHPTKYVRSGMGVGTEVRTNETAARVGG